MHVYIFDNHCLRVVAGDLRRTVTWGRWYQKPFDLSSQHRALGHDRSSGL